MNRAIMVGETAIISVMNDMCAESLPPDLHDAWESVRTCLEETRSALSQPITPETPNDQSQATAPKNMPARQPGSPRSPALPGWRITTEDERP